MNARFQNSSGGAGPVVGTGRLDWRAILLLMALLALWLGMLEYRDLFRPDEGRYAEIPLEMIKTGDWITPRLNDLKYLEKPPLQYWTTAIAYKALGVDEWTARLWPACTGLLGIVGLFFAGRALYGFAAGALSSLLLASTFGYMLFAHVLTLDMGFTVFVNSALLCTLLGQRSGVRAPHAWMLAAWVSMALATLSKGPVALVLAGLTLALDSVLTRDFRRWRALHWKTGTACFAVVVLPWFVLVQLRNPEFVKFFFIHEHFSRYLSDVHHRTGPWYYFIPVLLAGTLPWTRAMALTCVYGFRDFRAGRISRSEALLFSWMVVILVFFSISHSKLPAYVLPMFPALALLTGARLAKATPAAVLIEARTVAVLGLALIVGAAACFIAAPLTGVSRELAAFTPWMALAGSCLLVGATSLGRLVPAKVVSAFATASAATVLAFLSLAAGSQAFAPIYSADTLVDTAISKVGELDPQAPFFSLETYDQTLPVRLGHSVTVVAYRDELSLGLESEPYKAVNSIDEFRQRWRATGTAYAVMSLARFDEERLHGTAMEELARDSHLVFVRRSCCP